MREIIYKSSPVLDSIQGYHRLWSIHDYAVWDALYKHQVLRVDERLARDLHDWRDSYDWMSSQMKKRLPVYDEPYPWWAWYQPKPDLRKWRGFLKKERLLGKKVVLIELMIPRGEVLLSSFLAWHMVILEGYVATSRESYDVWEKRLADAGITDEFDPLPATWHDELIQSWERIFDIQALADGDAWDAHQIQATFGTLRMNDVLSVTSY